MKTTVNDASLSVKIERLGIALAPLHDELDAAGVLNPASARTRDGRLILYPRVVAYGNVSRIGIYEHQTDGTFVRRGMALEPSMPYEFRSQEGGYGCEDARVTFIPVLDRYLMCYTAFGPEGPRIALAESSDGYVWTRLGRVNFQRTEFDGAHDKDAAFFPEPVLSPDGVTSLAFYHRPAAEREGILHEDIRIAYVPLAPVLEKLENLLHVDSSICVAPAAQPWGQVKVGGGTPPVRTEFGWLSLFHGVDRTAGETFSDKSFTYRAGILIHDLQSPHLLRYRSPAPILSPETHEERIGTVNSVVFPTAIDTWEMPEGSAMVYYGMADSTIGVARLDVRSFREND